MPGSFIVLSAFFSSYAQVATPNYTTDTLFNVNGTGSNVARISYADGIGRTLQSRTQINTAANSALVSGTDYDSAGRQEKQAKAFFDSSQSYAPLQYYDCPSHGYSGIAARSSALYGDSAYSSTQYYDDPLNRTKSSGAPGDSFTASRHPARQWTFGVTGGISSGAYFDSAGFISPGHLQSVRCLDDTIPAALESVNPSFLQYSLSVSQDPNGNFSQTIKDKFGNTLRNASSSTLNSVISAASFDIQGRVLSRTPPQTSGKEVAASAYAYNTLGQVVSKYTPDASHAYYRYDDAGRVSSCIDSNCLAANSTRDSIKYNYDALGRTVTVGEMYSGNFYTRTRTIYDDPADAKRFLTKSLFDSTNIDSLLATVSNTMGKPVAVISYDDNYRPAAPGDSAEAAYANKVIDLLSYDDEGRVLAKYRSVPGMHALQKVYYTYDIHGKMLTTAFRDGNNPADLVYAYDYDADGRISDIKKNDTVFVSYAYDRLGRLSRKTFTVVGVSYPVVYDYNIRDWVKTINANSGQFSESMYYEKDALDAAAGFTPQYNGNIARIKTATAGVNDTAAGRLDQVYSYDFMNRLTGVNNIQNPLTDNYDADFSYLDDGRILTKHEGANKSWGQYGYYTSTNKLQGIAGSTKTGYNYIYDGNGNMVLDKSKKLAIEYDWRNMPKRFIVYDAIPAGVNSWSDVQALQTTFGVNKIHEIVMLYDASGNRVKKETVEAACTTCPDLNASDGSLILLNTANGAAYKFNKDGTLQTCKQITHNDMGNPDPDALLLQNNGISMLAFNNNRLQINNALIDNSATASSGNLIFVNDSAGGTRFVEDQNNGNLLTAGHSTSGTVEDGVAYVDGRVFTWSQSAGQYLLSYTEAAGEGVVRSNGALEVYIKDHLGSTRAVIVDYGNLKEANAYYAYGTHNSIGSTPTPEERARMGFTGKEYDGDVGIGLTYFGARYYDPEIGLWISCDKKGQFSSPYLYGGNGTNAVVFVDEDGNFLFLIPILLGAAIGGISGGIVAAHSGKNIWAGFGIGAGIGALSGFTGGLASMGTSALFHAGAVASGSVGGAIGGFTSGFMNTWAFGGKGSDFFQGNINRALSIGWKSALVGGIVGGLVGSGAEFLKKSVLPEQISIPGISGSTMSGQTFSSISYNLKDALNSIGLGGLYKVTIGNVLSAAASNFTPIVNAGMKLGLIPHSVNIPGPSGGEKMSLPPTTTTDLPPSLPSLPSDQYPRRGVRVPFTPRHPDNPGDMSFHMEYDYMNNNQWSNLQTNANVNGGDNWLEANFGY